MGRVFYTSFTKKNIDKIIGRLSGKREYLCTIPYCNSDSELLISRVLLKLLSNVYQEKLHQNIDYIISELIHNSCKANMRRHIFTGLDLDMTNSEDYRKGIIGLKENLISNRSEIEKDIKKNNFYVKINFRIVNHNLDITIENNSQLLEIDKKAIAKNINFSKGIKSLSQVLTENLSNGEGSGYGLIVVMLMLKKICKNDDCLEITSETGITTTKLTIPLNVINDDQGSVIADNIIDEIKSLPQFPDSIIRLQRELKDPGCNFDTIADFVLADSALSAEVLRIVNSPVYTPDKKIEKVTTAISIIGMSGLQAILYSYGATMVFNERYNPEIVTNLKEHMFQVALISSFLANIIGLNKFAEDIYLAALLHDFGKIILNSLSANIVKKIDAICLEEQISSSVIENLAHGYNHSKIGAELAKKWHFPQKYIHVIENHHSPLNCDDEFKNIVYCVYLGNEVCHYIHDEIRFSSINEEVLKFFKLETHDKFEIFLNDIKKEGLFY